eukprot:CAMPEP_0201655548 /NCGR_PEP_ID=MMETSP0493-20130528/46064_1 /ASSEMBLY_ACC=CAM_ASM_000838 /TAXON_ID=420259 /ORGANISM="Thalassiosira gravida, Strain GMp14c1" /LENGTH=670 /DNA_ID=CAMNT_0048132137 /DNA_START=1151 /DNA_END=3160 /DNA_ORIENTATION=-
MMLDPDCGQSSSSSSSNIIPERCYRRWCYVNAMECMGASTERVYRSKYFPAGSGIELYYSSSTCGYSASDWEESLSQQNSNHVLGGESLKAITAAYNIVPYVYKRNSNGDIPEVPGEEYYNNTIPYEGVHINYVKSLQQISNGDFDVDFVHGSRASISRIHRGSPGNAAVQDVADGLVDIAIGPFWITGARLKRTAFTMPVQYDHTVLVIPRPGMKRSVIEESKKVLDPFTVGVWVLLIGMIAVTAVLSVWFSEKRSRQPSVYARLALDEFLHKGIFFCSAGVEQDESASLPRKLLMFGFGFFILIVVSAYVANLAAFLTRSYSPPVSTIEDVIARQMNICAHPVLADDIKLTHPKANFVFNQEGKELYGLVDDYDAKKCEVMAVGKMDSLGDLKLIDLFCARDLVFTDSLVMENPVGFPIRSDLASGFSYWMYQGEKYHDIDVQILREEYNEEFQRQPSCNVLLSEQSSDENSEYAKIDVANLFLPFMFFVVFAVVGALLQLYYRCAVKQKESESQTRAFLWATNLLGSHSTLNLRGSSRKKLKRYSSGISSKADDEDEIVGIQLPTFSEDSNATFTLATGSFGVNKTVCIDGIRDDPCSLGSGSQGIDNGQHELEMEDENLFYDPEEDASLSRLLGKLEDVMDRYQEVKRKKNKAISHDAFGFLYFHG